MAFIAWKPRQCWSLANFSYASKMRDLNRDCILVCSVYRRRLTAAPCVSIGAHASRIEVFTRRRSPT